MDLPCKKSDVLFVFWRDAVTRRRQTDDDAVMAEQQLAVNWSIGYVRHENDKRLVLAFEGSDTGEIDDTLIPKEQIIARIPVIKPRTLGKRKAKSDVKDAPEAR